MSEKGIMKIPNNNNNNNDVAILFVHGLSGHPLKTWTKKGNSPFPNLLSEDEECDEFDIYTFGYDTNFIFKKHHFKIIANILLSEIKGELKEYKSLIFITHSMGGIIVQSLITQLLEVRNQDFIDKIAGIIYLAVPFFGSKVASGFTLIPRLVLPQFLLERSVSAQVLSLKAFSSDLSELSNKWGEYNRQGLLDIDELNIYGHSDKTVSVEFANVAHIKNSMGVDETHISICKVDRNSTVYKLVKQFLKEIYTKKKVVPEMELENYKEWLQQKSQFFYVPRVNVPLSVDDAFASLYVLDELKTTENKSLEDAIANYHEWARLSIDDQKKKLGQDILMAQKRAVVIGGPGSGKSTLAQKMVNKFVKKGEKVLYFKFSYLANVMAQGRTFEEALWGVSLDGYFGNKERLKEIFKSIDILIGDGLDESAKNMDLVTQSLKDWLIGRENTKVIITTRPIGHNPVQFQDFSYFEILPLDKREIERYSKIVLCLLEDEKSDELHQQFLDRIDKSKMINFASRSPLLLNFLILLLISGKEFGNYRCELYEKILNEWLNDSKRVKNHKIGLDLALKSIEWIGWLIQNSLEEGNGIKEEMLIEKLMEFIIVELKETSLNSKEKARECLNYWVDLGVLEKIKIGYEIGYTFIHMTLGEFSAAKYVNSFNEQDKREFLVSKLHKPIWRETLLLCAGLGSGKIFIETILRKNKNNEDFYNDTSLAAAMLLESPKDYDLIHRVSTEALGLLRSSIPSLSIEMGRSLMEVAKQDPIWMKTLVEPLLAHEYLWTKLMAYKVIFATNHFQVHEDLLDVLLNMKPAEEYCFPSLVPSALSTEWNSVVELLIIKILDEGCLTDEKLQGIFSKLKDGGFNVRFKRNISKKLNELNKSYLLEIFNSDFKSIFSEVNFKENIKRIRKSEKEMLELIIKSFSPKKIDSNKIFEPLVEISKFIKALGILEQQLNDVVFLVSKDPEVVMEIFKGITLAYNLEKDFIYYDAKFLIDKLDNDYSFFYGLPDSSELNIINTDIGNEVDTNKILRGLIHPSETIKMNSTVILANLNPSKLLLEQIKHEFMQATGWSLRYFSIVLFHWLEDPLDLFIEKINKNHEGVQYILEFIQKPSDPVRVNNLKDLLIKMLNSKDDEIVQYTAMAIKELAIDTLNEEVLKVIFYWDEIGAKCEKHKIRTKGTCCPECNVVPRTPISNLLEILIESDNLTFEHRVYFVRHKNSYVNKEGKKSLTYFLNKNNEFISEIIRKIKDEANAIALFEALMEIEQKVLTLYLVELVSVYESQDILIRQKLIKELSERRFNDKKLIKSILVKALNDPAVQVRDQALESYRLLEL